MVVVDSHCDTALRLLNGDSMRNSLGHWSLKRAKHYDGFVQIFAAFVSPEYQDSAQRCLALLDSLEREIDKNSDIICKATSYQDIDVGLKENKTVALLAVEGGFGSDLSMVKILYDKGVRCMGLCWNQDTPLCGGVLGKGGGVTTLGKKAVEQMNYYGFFIDVSHCSDQSFFDLTCISEKPLIATHSNSRKICDNPRNLTDEQFVLIRDMGGMVGLNPYPLFLNGTKEADVKDFIRHLDHFLELGGESCIGLGCDFDGIEFCMNNFEGIQNYDYLYESLRLYYPDELVNNLFCGNYLRFFKNYL